MVAAYLCPVAAERDREAAGFDVSIAVEALDPVPVAVLQASDEPRMEVLARWSAAAETQPTRKVDMPIATYNPLEAVVVRAVTG